jgi:NADH dehydrogenase FAD-containing subunit
MTDSKLAIRGMESKDAALNLDFLIVGAGPAGASLACFLGKYGSSAPAKWSVESLFMHSFQQALEV